jgi:DNA replicative helicase MCM subunit Mcm2 (Cdc46/Mcm family)
MELLVLSCILVCSAVLSRKPSLTLCNPLTWKIFDEVLGQWTKKLFPYYESITKEVHVRMTDIPLSDKIRDLRQGHLNSLIRVCGVVTRRTTVFPQV